jgi:ribonuclease HI
VFGNVHSFVKSAEEELLNIQSDIQNLGSTDTSLEIERQAQLRLDDALQRQDLFWQEKANVKWHLDGDRNTSYFHRIAKIKNTTKALTTIRVGDDILSDPQHIADHIVQYYKSLFCTNLDVLQDQSIVDDVIPKVIDDRLNSILTMLPSPEEIKNAVFDLNKDSAPGPDGFGAFFFQTYWDIVHHDVVNAVLEFFNTGWLLPNFNANTIILIPKSSSADTIDQFRPIAMANFKFKIISKIIADRVSQILPTIISTEQRGFIHGRNIRDCICLASEAANLLHSKSFGGNLALKIDITKAFDTLEWSFILKVLRSFGFNEKFCNWIDVILKSANLSISINGKMHGYFNCSRGVRQGDPLSPLLFCIAEDVLSRYLSKLVDEGKLQLIKGTKSIKVPSHCLYADDIMIYCKGTQANLIALRDLFTRYALASGQIVNASKSTIYSGSISNARLLHIANSIGFSIGTMPFWYLGVPIFKGKPKRVHLQPIADRIKSKLAAWKASLLSIAGRLQLVKSVVQSMLVYSISVYSWPVSLLKEIEKWLKNFIWSGDLSQRKLVTVAWKKICKPLSEGGLGLRSLIILNEASNLKLCWDFLQSNEQWATLLKDRVLRGNNCINHHVFSSIWSSIKSEFSVILENSRFLIGDGKTISFWNDKWCNSQSVAQFLHIPDAISLCLNSFVSDFIFNFHWNIPPELLQMFPALSLLIANVTLPLDHKQDCRYWNLTDSGNLSLKEAYSFKCHHSAQLHWAKLIWCKDIPPSKSLLAWRLMHDKLPTDDNLRLRGCNLPSICNLCLNQEESSFHLFFDCPFAVNIWTWLSQIIGMQLQFQSIEDIWKICDRNWTPQCKLVIRASLVNIISTIWFVRNQARFHDKIIHWSKAISIVKASVSLSGNMTNLTYYSSMTDFVILKTFRVNIHPHKAPSIKEVLWAPPLSNWIKCNTDGSSTSSASACAGIFRNSDSDFIGGFAENVGLQNAFFAELAGVFRAIELADLHHWYNLWIETDSLLVVKAFKSDVNIPWSLRNRWFNCQLILRNMNFLITHIYREGNECADTLANIGLTLVNYTFWNEAPVEIVASLFRNKLGLPCYRFSC